MFGVTNLGSNWNKESFTVGILLKGECRERKTPLQRAPQQGGKHLASRIWIEAVVTDLKIYSFGSFCCILVTPPCVSFASSLGSPGPNPADLGSETAFLPTELPQQPSLVLPTRRTDMLFPCILAQPKSSLHKLFSCLGFVSFRQGFGDNQLSSGFCT